MKQIIVKIINVTAVAKDIKINLQGANNIGNKAQLQIVASDNLDNMNSFKEPKKVSIVTKTLNDVSKAFVYNAEKYSASVIRVKTN